MSPGNLPRAFDPWSENGSRPIDGRVKRIDARFFRRRIRKGALAVSGDEEQDLNGVQGSKEMRGTFLTVNFTI